MEGVSAERVFVVQIAQLGGELGGDGGWIDHEVYLDRVQAEERARLLETAPIEDEAGRDVTRERVTTARVITGEGTLRQFGSRRVSQMLREFNDRLLALMSERDDA